MTRPSSDIQAIICDVDGCLCAETTAPLDLESLAIIAEHNASSAEAAGSGPGLPSVTLCTGRPIGYAECIARHLGTRLPIMAENGVWLWDRESNTHQMDPSITEDHLEAVAAYQKWVRTELAPDGVVIQPGKAASVTLHHPDTERLSGPVFDRASERIEREGWPFRVSMTWFYINCDLKHIDKASAIARFKQQTGLGTDQLAGIGDTMIDAKIAESVAWFACPANAADALKPHAHYISEHEEARGVVDILKALTGAAENVVA